MKVKEMKMTQIYLDLESQKIKQELFGDGRNFSSWVQEKLKQEKGKTLDISFLQKKVTDLDVMKEKLEGDLNYYKNQLVQAKTKLKETEVQQKKDVKKVEKMQKKKDRDFSIKISFEEAEKLYPKFKDSDNKTRKKGWIEFVKLQEKEEINEKETLDER